MYVRVTTIRFDPARTREVVQLSEQQLFSAFKWLPGFRNSTAALDREAGHGVAHHRAHPQFVVRRANALDPLRPVRGCVSRNK